MELQRLLPFFFLRLYCFDVLAFTLSLSVVPKPRRGAGRLPVLSGSIPHSFHRGFEEAGQRAAASFHASGLREMNVNTWRQYLAHRAVNVCQTAVA